MTITSFVNPNARCPVCGDKVFFYRSPFNGRVFFDELGPPWPKHPCTDNSTEHFPLALSTTRSSKTSGLDLVLAHPQTVLAAVDRTLAVSSPLSHFAPLATVEVAVAGVRGGKLVIRKFVPCRTFGYAPGRIRTSDTRFRKAPRCVSGRCGTLQICCE
jgi:hypothetical protein